MAEQTNGSTPRPVNTCSGCNATWTGLAAAHCAAEKTIAIPLAIDNDGLGLFADDSQLDSRAGQRFRLAVTTLADLVSEEAGAVKGWCPARADSYQAEVSGGDWTSVQWSIIGPAAAGISDYIIEQGRAGGGRVLAGFEVRLADGRDLHLMLDLPKPSQQARRRPVSPWSIQVTAACHRTFASATLFDLHRMVTEYSGRCVKPSDVRCKSGPNEGQRLIFFRDGMFRAPELTPTERARLQRGTREESVDV